MIIPRHLKNPIDTSVYSRMMRPTPPAPGILYLILNEVSLRSSIPVKELVSKSREREIVEARQIYYKRAREVTKESFVAIGKIVNAHHATVIYGIKTVNQLKHLTERYDIYFNGKVPVKEKVFEIKPLKLIIGDFKGGLQNDFINPFRNHSVCTNQPYMGYKTI